MHSFALLQNALFHDVPASYLLLAIFLLVAQTTTAEPEEVPDHEVGRSVFRPARYALALEGGPLPEEQPMEKRRLGLRMPNILRLSDGDGDAFTMHKRRLGLRMPNIIYMREPGDKRFQSSNL
ncbi:NLP-19 protein [Aphelenchoides avenae]|nr:NLP-19 protein [Aphelenchus avenae]